MHLPFAYFDTSTYLKLYVSESGSASASTYAQKNRIVSSAILALECFSALSRKKKERELSAREFDTIRRQLKNDSSYMEIIKLTDEVIEKAEAIVLKSTARPLDAIHIASAIIFQNEIKIALPFFTSDRKQHEAALNEGLKAVFTG
jgi:predicted nucleic acid-binding protein